MSAGGGDLQRSATARVAAHLQHVGHRPFVDVARRRYRRGGFVTAEVRDDIAKVSRGADNEAGGAGGERFGAVVLVHDERTQASPRGRFGSQDRAANGTERSIHCELGGKHRRCEGLGDDLPGCREHRDCDRQVVVRSVLPDVDGFDVDVDAAGWPLQARCEDCGPNTHARLTGCRVGEADNVE
ncbi:MAG TPA: hypothetical protein VGF99_13170 [Myxococcota bacterium]